MLFKLLMLSRIIMIGVFLTSLKASTLNLSNSLFLSLRIEKIYLCGITAKPPHKDIHKTALGSTDTVDWEYVENTLNLIEKLKADNVKICSIEQAENAIMLNAFKTKSNTKYALVFGNEVKGVNQEVVNTSDAVIEIPQFGTKHSLNISVSCGVVVWDIFVKLSEH